MRVTLAQYQLLTSEEKALVTHIVADVVEPEPFADMQVIFLRERFETQWDKDHEDEGR